jgi:hypothetical protein
MIDLRGLLQEAIDQAVDGNSDLCVTIESVANPDKWIQLTWDTVNAAYPYADNPLDHLRELKLPDYPDLKLVTWEPNKFATFGHAANDVDRIAKFVGAYLEALLGVCVNEETLRIQKEML